MEIQYYELKNKVNFQCEYNFCKIIKVTKNHITFVYLPSLVHNLKKCIENEHIIKSEIYFKIYEYNELGKATIDENDFIRFTQKKFFRLFERINLQELKGDKNISDDEFLKNNDYRLYFIQDTKNNVYDIICNTKNNVIN